MQYPTLVMNFLNISVKTLSSTVCVLLIILILACCGRGGPSGAVPAKSNNVASQCDFRFDKAGLCASLVWLKIPSLAVDGRMKITFTKILQNEKIDPGYTVLVLRRMPWMGCPSREINPTKIASGIFEANLSLDGMKRKFKDPNVSDLEILIQLKTGDIVIDESSAFFNL